MCSDEPGSREKRGVGGEYRENLHKIHIGTYSCYYLQLVLLEKSFSAKLDTDYRELYIHKAEPKPLPSTIRVNFESRQFYQFFLSLLLPHPTLFMALLDELEFAQLQLIELLLTFTRTFDRFPNLQKLKLTR